MGERMREGMLVDLLRIPAAPRQRRKPKDWQRSLVYKAEYKLIHQMERFGTVQECQLIVNRIVESKWWAERHGRGSVIVMDGRARRAAAGSRYRVWLPRFARDYITICHELAHVACLREHDDQVPAHGITWARIYLEMVKRWAGKEFEAELRQHFLDEGVKFRGREII